MLFLFFYSFMFRQGRPWFKVLVTSLTSFSCLFDIDKNSCSFYDLFLIFVIHLKKLSISVHNDHLPSDLFLVRFQFGVQVNFTRKEPLHRFLTLSLFNPFIL